MLDKSLNNINCIDINKTVMHRKNALVDYNQSDVNHNLSEFHRNVCAAEFDSQELNAKITLYLTPIETILAIIIILFVGAWSDRTQKRKLCIIIPVYGRLISTICYSISIMFMRQTGIELILFSRKILYTIFGGETLFQMGIYSYLTQITPKEERTFRFSVVSGFTALMGITINPISGILFEALNFTKLFILCLILNLFGIIYAHLYIKESNHPIAPRNVNGIQTITINSQVTMLSNKDLDTGLEIRCGVVENNGRVAEHRQQKKIIKNLCKANCLLKFFNPVIAVECMKIIVKKREKNKRGILIFLLIVSLINLVTTSEYFNNFTRVRLNWSTVDISFFYAFKDGIKLFGLAILMYGLKNLVKLSNSLIGTFGTFLCSISKILFAISTTSTMVYIATTVNMFEGIGEITIKSILSTIINPDELGRIFSIMGIIQAIGGFIFVSIHSIIFHLTLTTFPGAFFIFSSVLLFITTINFIILHFIFKDDKSVTNETIDINIDRNINAN